MEASYLLDGRGNWPLFDCLYIVIINLDFLILDHIAKELDLKGEKVTLLSFRTTFLGIKCGVLGIDDRHDLLYSGCI